MHHGGCLTFFTLSIILGIASSDSKNPSYPKTIMKQSSKSDDEFERNMNVLINNIRSLSKEEKSKEARSSLHQSMNRIAVDSTNLDVYLAVFNSLYTIYQPMLVNSFIGTLPHALICILAGQQHCGWQGDLASTVSSELNTQVLSLISSLKAQACTPTFSLRMADSTTAQLTSVQEMLANALSSDLPNDLLSDNFIAFWNSLMDMTIPPVMSLMSDIMPSLLQTPVNFLQLGLQFGIKIPTSENCQQCDLKQLIMWGMSHNVSWSFEQSILDIFLGPASLPCIYPSPECQTSGSVQFGRMGTPLDIPTSLLTCEQQNLNQLNETLCAGMLSTGSQESYVLYQMCQALSTLSQTEVTQVWKNTCRIIQNIILPLMEPCNETVTTKSSQRNARSVLSLNELLCNYYNWTVAGAVDPALVTMCSENDREAFITAVCNNANVMQVLVSNPSNTWVWEYCANSSDTYVVNLYCSYSTWTFDTVDPSIVTFCWNNDMERLERFLCENLEFFMVVFSNENNNWLNPNCSEPPAEVNINALVADSCTYSEWSNTRAVTTIQISLCIQNDEIQFIRTVCVNSTFVTALALNSANAWVEQYCTYAVSNPPTSPPLMNTADWCDYKKWNISVDSSVVALCWQYDQTGFRQNVCCSVELYEKLSMHPDNQWLIRECSDNDTVNVLAQVCVYSDWSQPTIVDMADLALCADLDTKNFTKNVCANDTVLQNLMANLDNTWLLEQCSNLTGSGTGSGAGNGSSLMGFRPSEQCQYSSWVLVLPDPALLALCWDYDQANFISSVCTDPSVLTQITQEASSFWVGTLCATYTGPYIPTVNGGNSTQPQPCLFKDLVDRLNWSCSADFSSVCQPGASQAQGLRILLRCGIQILQPRFENMMTTKMASMVRRATSLWVVVLLALEESQMTTLRVTENIRLSVLETMVAYMENESNFDNKRVLLQCFGNVLTSLMLTGRDVASSFFLIKEYFRIPLSYLRSVLSSADLTVVREILQYYNRNHATLQLSDEYLHTMVSVLFQTHLPKDISLFADMGLLLALATPSDIMSMPPLQNNINALSIINLSIKNLSLEQQQAFGRWFSQSLPNITDGSLSFIGDTGNLIAYLPFRSFQYLSPAQLLDGLDVLQSNVLGPLKQQFIAQSVIGAFRNLTADQFKSLGNMSCLANYNQLMAYAGTKSFSVIQDNIRTCVIQGVSIPSSMISSLVLNASELQFPSSLMSQRISQLAPFLPLMGSGFLQQLSSAQLMPALSTLSSVPFTPAQAAVIIDKISANLSLALSGSGQLSTLGSLVSGVKVETLSSLPSDVLLEALPVISSQTPGLTPTQTIAIVTKLWGSASVHLWLDKVESLLPSTPLLCVIPKVSLLLVSDKAVHAHLWNTQQAQVLFKEATDLKPSLSEKEFISLGTIASGVSCTALKNLFQNLADSLSSLRNILKFLREQPVPLHASLTKCISEALYKLDFFSDLIGDLGSQIALSLPLSPIKKFPPDKMDSLRNMIVEDPQYFLLLPSTKQAVLVDKIVQRLDMYTGLYTERKFRSLDVMATFVVDEMFLQLDRSFFVDSLEFLQGFCYNANKRNLVAGMLQEKRTFGPVQNWTSDTLNQVDRFLFFLPKEIIQQIPATVSAATNKRYVAQTELPVDLRKDLINGLMSLERIERLFQSQQRWERGERGSLCKQMPSDLFEKKQFVLQYFLGFLKVGRSTFTGLIPSCESLHMTQPATWSINSLRNMPAAAFRRCLELIGQDSLFSLFQLSVLLTKTKEVYGPPSSFNTSVISQLGRIATQLSVEELASLKLSEIESISAMGAVNIWTSRQLKTIFSNVLNSTRKTPAQLDSSTLVALGYIVCGIEAPVIRNLNATEFSKAVLWLGRLHLSCTEEQLQAMIRLLSQTSAFGPVSSWETDVFIEIGATAAGLPDLSMSALVRDQIVGITPSAISLIPANKFAVVFNQAQIQMFTYEQAIAVTDSQRSALSPVQKTALSMVLNPWEDKPIDFRGWSMGVAMHPCHFFCLSNVLILLLLFPLG